MLKNNNIIHKMVAKEVSDGRIKFRVDEENKVVVAYFRYKNSLGACCEMLERFIDAIDGEATYGISYKDLKKVGLTPERFIGVAKCAPCDEFDEKVGKKVALQKLEIHINKMIFSYFVLMYDKYYSLACHMDEHWEDPVEVVED